MAGTGGLLYFSFLCLLWLLSCLLLRRIFFKKATKSRLPPSPPSLPLIGHIHHLSAVAHQCFHNLSSKYGPLLTVRLGSYSFVLVSSAPLAAEIFKTQDLTFASKPKSFLDDSILFGSVSFSLAPYGDYWRFIKKLCLTELLSPRQIERSRHIRHEELACLLRKMMEKGLQKEGVDLGSEFMRLTNNVTCRTAMRTKCSGEDNEAEKCRVLVEEAFALSVKMGVANFCGPLRKLCIWGFRKQVNRVVSGFDELMEKLLSDHEERAKVDAGEDKDLMDILLRVYHDKEAEVKISRDNLKAFFLDIFVAGTSTSADAMQWTMAELINHPNVFKKLREEIKSVAGDRLVQETDVPSLPYLQAVVKETLRLYPPAPLIPRASREQCSIGGYDIPKDTQIFINAYAIMRDPEVWENPNDFKPERFLTLEKENCSYVPFGGGRRMCPGSTLAYTMIHSTLAAMVQCFDWKAGVGKEGAMLNMEPKAGGGTMSMAHPLLCLPVLHFNPFASG